MREILVKPELRGDELLGTILTEGQAANSLQEVFSLNSCQWGSTGIQVKPSHSSESGAVRAYPWREGAEVKIRCRLSPELRQAFADGARKMSVEFHALAEHRTKSGIRQIERCLLIGAALTRRPCYKDTNVEIRDNALNVDPVWYL